MDTQRYCSSCHNGPEGDHSKCGTSDPFAALVPPDPPYSPAMQLAISKFREMLSGTPDEILSCVYFHSTNEGIDKAKPDSKMANGELTIDFLNKRLNHLIEMRDTNGHAEVAKEFRNLAEGMIKGNGPPTEKHLAMWIQAVTSGISETAKQAAN